MAGHAEREGSRPPARGVDNVHGEAAVVDDPVFEIGCEPLLPLRVPRAALRRRTSSQASSATARRATHTRAVAHAGAAPVLAAKSCSPTRLGR